MSAPGPRPPWRTVDGILLLDKPVGWSSNQALQRVRRLYRARKAGHTGSLDPLATGVLPLCFGEATKVAGLLLDADKTYEATVALGASSATGDAEGEIVARAPVPPLDARRVIEALDSLRGVSEQVPPMYSALKRGGQALYALARKGVVVDREPRPIRITDIGLIRLAPDAITFRVTCSKGTYVRTLAETLAERLGTLGHLTALRRTAVGGSLANHPAHALADLEALAGRDAALDALLLPLDTALGFLPAVHLDAAQATAIRHGRPVAADAPSATPLRLYDPDGRFVGLGRRDPGEPVVRALRLLNTALQAAD